jgi:hypothetical protein
MFFQIIVCSSALWFSVPEAVAAAAAVGMSGGGICGSLLERDDVV